MVAVAQAAATLHHAIAEGHVGHGAARYLMVFFAIWWAWMNFTWFASAYDTDDALYRLATLVQIAGALVLAAGVPRAFDDGDFAVVTLGYVIMRLADGRAVAARGARRPGAPARPRRATRSAWRSCRSAGCCGLLLPADAWACRRFLVLVARPSCRCRSVAERPPR